MKLKELLRDIRVLEMNADPELNIESVVYDSRKVTPGCLFAAISGFASDGNRFIPMAMEKGASVVVTAKRPEQPVPYVLVDNDRLSLAMLGTNFFGHPARDLVLVGVTGTNGKTSVTWLLKQVIEKVTGEKSGLIGTMENRIGEEVIPTERTTPESFDLQALFARMRSAGCKYCVMEVSSHAIALERVGGVHFDVAAFTNLSEDHLDFHKTMEAYCDTKAVLFSRCGKAVINADDSWAARIEKNAACPVLHTAVEHGDLHAEDIELRADGVSFTATLGALRCPAKLSIPGKFTVSNALTVLGIAVQLGLPLEAAAAALADATGVKGRVEVVPTPRMPFTVLIDYAHTPDGLENVLSSLRSHCAGRLICVFGCGGDRDPMKRPIMGRIGAELSDIAIVTSDNPRSEAPMAIIEDVLQGIPEGMGTVHIIENRRQAIRFAMDIAEKNDMIVLAGKGHETYQEISGVKYHLDEREEVAARLLEMRK